MAISYSREEACARLGIRGAEFQGLIESGKLEPFRILGAERFNTEDVDRLCPKVDEIIIPPIKSDELLGVIDLRSYPMSSLASEQSLPSALGIKLLTILDQALARVTNEDLEITEAFRLRAEHALSNETLQIPSNHRVDLAIQRLQVGDWEKFQPLVLDSKEAYQAVLHARELVLQGLSMTDQITLKDRESIVYGVSLIGSLLTMQALILEATSDKLPLSSSVRRETLTKIAKMQEHAKLIAERIVIRS